MPLRLEVYDERKNLVPVGIILPESIPGSMSDVSQGTRQVYMFECARDDSHSTIHRSRAGIDVEQGESRVISSAQFVQIMKLHRGESYSISLQPEGSPVQREIRFTHY